MKEYRSNLLFANIQEHSLTEKGTIVFLSRRVRGDAEEEEEKGINSVFTNYAKSC
jgi:hypothetical protein